MTTPGRSFSQRLRDPWTALLVVAGLGLFTYRGLLGARANALIPAPAEGTEGLFFEPYGGSPAIILAAWSWLLWRRRERLRSALGRPPQWLAVGLLLPLGLAFALRAYHVEEPGLLVLSLMVLLPGAGALLGGAPGLRALLLPSAFLVFAVPIPAVLLNQIIFPLQLLTAQLTDWLLAVFGVPALLEGDQILTRGRVFQVVETCSGLRLIETLTMAAVIYVEAFGRRGRHALCLVLAAPVIGMLVNVARVLSIVFNPYSELSAVHTTQGVAMLVFGILALAALDRLLEPLLRSTSPPRPLPTEDGSPGPFPSLRVVGFGVLLGALGLTTWLLPTWSPPPDPHRPVYDLLKLIREPPSTTLAIDQVFLGSARFSQGIHRRYRLNGGTVDLFVAVDDRLEPRRSLVSPKTELPGAGWTLEERSILEVDSLERPVNRLLVRSRGERALVLHWYRGISSFPLEVARAALVLDRGPLRRSDRLAVVRVTTMIEPTPSGRADAEARLKKFVELIRPALERIGTV